MKLSIKISMIALAAGMMWSVTTAAATLITPAAQSTSVSTTPALITQVAPNCAMPKQAAKFNVFYIDPAKGKITNNGSQAAPWNTLADVVKKGLIGGGGVVKPGDTVYLMNGNHGSVYIRGIHNSDFITIAAAPGHKPVLNYLGMGSVEKFIIQGLKLQSIKTGLGDDWRALFSVGAGGATSKDIIFDGNILSSQDNVDAWTQQDWMKKARAGLLTDGRSPLVTATQGVTCLTVTNNKFSNVISAVGLRTDRTLFSGNTINNFAYDGIDFAASDLVIANNRITNSLDMGDGKHTDAMQGQLSAGPGYTDDLQKYKNVTITGNVVIAVANPKLKFPNAGLQGISAFDSDWTNVKVTNNTVITTAYHGMTFASVHNSLFANNTIVSSGANRTWLSIGDRTHAGTPSSNVTVRDNVAHTLLVGAQGVDLKNNFSSYFAITDKTGKVWRYTKVGTNPANNTVLPPFNSNFVKVDVANAAYDTYPVANSPAKGTGAAPIKVNVK